jgi:DNA-binding Lrp family transcriptional regulator
VVQDRPAAGRFGASQVAAEVNRRFAGALEKPVSTNTVGKNLRRLHKAGVIRTVRKGVSHKEGLFEKVPHP